MFLTKFSYDSTDLIPNSNSFEIKAATIDQYGCGKCDSVIETFAIIFNRISSTGAKDVLNLWIIFYTYVHVNERRTVILYPIILRR